MKYVQFTYVDVQTGVPVSETPAANGPTIPEGIIPTFDLQNTRSQQAPIVFGFIPDEAEELFDTLPEFIREVDEDSFFSAFKEELKERARTKRIQMEQGGVMVNDSVIGTTIEDQNRVTGMATTLMIDPDMESIDFEYSPGQWINISREVGLAIGVAVARHVQHCFSWCRNVHEQIDSMEIDINSLENAMPILEAINSFGLTDSTPEGEEPTDEE
ncbi:MAG: DUF4376 domain-containing protein [Gammaproteobacteria bacterium]|nr:DUF4376 domain-containing protein [Gammaproteobacteria bacterium]